MPSDRQDNEQSLAEKLLRAYEKSHSTADFGEVKNQIAAVEWVELMMTKLEENERRANGNGR
ncbi:MAG TPA: hypothetical protein V6D09_23165 [Leptolyngbyaceae cyanobacterium]